MMKEIMALDKKFKIVRAKNKTAEPLSQFLVNFVYKINYPGWVHDNTNPYWPGISAGVKEHVCEMQFILDRGDLGD
jgi:hypothetical protein